MVGLRGVGILGVSVAVAGGVAYLIWNYASSSGKKEPKAQPGEDGISIKEEDERKEEHGKEINVVEETVEVVAAAPSSLESKPVESEGTQVLVLGLDGAGKSSLLQCFATGSLEQDMEPTQGFNAVSINREDLHIEFLEIGGKKELRPYWQRYMSKAIMLVFVVDSSKPQLFSVAKTLLHEVLAGHPSLPVMVLAHKQDLPGAGSISDLFDGLCLSELGDRKLYVINTHVKKGDSGLSEGVQDARDIIFQMVCNGK
ncbi:ADP-ribosylation factor-like protein 9 [Cheilinus undulatus]|uniref:ADP-ribosylation factor-like protein 9 n=1 Tax=Cheilinus undulatus TaxID=241271 RepID=UPI001BD239AA|nr:ADP-ribosylation factor-like protein 9 [Cheilinus undulatus]